MICMHNNTTAKHGDISKHHNTIFIVGKQNVIMYTSGKYCDNVTTVLSSWYVELFNTVLEAKANTSPGAIMLKQSHIEATNIN